jgi:hypothetical protein
MRKLFVAFSSNFHSQKKTFFGLSADLFRPGFARHRNARQATAGRGEYAIVLLKPRRQKISPAEAGLVRNQQ